MNNGKFDGGQSTAEEKELRDFYQRLLNLTISQPAFSGKYFDLHSANIENTEGYSNRIISYARYSSSQRLIIAASFDKENKAAFSLKIPEELIREWKLKPGSVSVTDLLYQNVQTELTINENGAGTIDIELSPLGSFILELQE
jgi:hypothetical protein